MEVVENIEQEAVTATGEQKQSEAVLDTLIADEKPQEAGQVDQNQVAVYEVPDATVTNLTGMLSLIGIGFTFKGYANAAAVWGEDNCRELAIKLVPVFAKYSWGQRLITFLNTGGGMEEFALFPVALGMITATYQAMMADKEAIKKAEKEAAKPSETVEPGKVYSADSPLGSTFKFES